MSYFVEIEAWWRRPKLSREEENAILLGRAKRNSGPLIRLWQNKPLAEWPERGCRFAITATGSIITGDPTTVLHSDMVKGAGSIKEGETLIAGCVVPYRRAWTMYAVQNFSNVGAEGGPATQLLCSRLTTWADFIDKEKVYWPEPHEFGSELQERIDRESIN